MTFDSDDELYMPAQCASRTLVLDILIIHHRQALPLQACMR
jgi:hypothetical protein